MLKEEPFQILYEVQARCGEINQKIDSILQMLQVLETYMTYSNIMRDMAPSGDLEYRGTGKKQMKGNDAMNPQEFQKILSAMRKDDKPMTQDEFDTIFETLKQGKSKEEIARMEQMVQMAKSFMK